MHDFLGRVVMLDAGSPTAIGWAIHTVRKGGTVVIIGVYGPPMNLLPIGTAMNKGLTLRVAQCNTKRHMPHLLDHIRTGRVDARGLVSHRLPLSAVSDASRCSHASPTTAGRSSCIRTEPVPRALTPPRAKNIVTRMLPLGHTVKEKR